MHFLPVGICYAMLCYARPGQARLCDALYCIAHSRSAYPQTCFDETLVESLLCLAVLCYAVPCLAVVCCAMQCLLCSSIRSPPSLASGVRADAIPVSSINVSGFQRLAYHVARRCASVEDLVKSHTGLQAFPVPIPSCLSFAEFSVESFLYRGTVGRCLSYNAFVSLILCECA